uniref:Uncharacterized protein n=1 Tax=Cacopsylla melanoneura TaxID=428564 RepID=A0A8D9F485_9HEMI
MTTSKVTVMSHQILPRTKLLSIKKTTVLNFNKETTQTSSGPISKMRKKKCQLVSQWKLNQQHIMVMAPKKMKTASLLVTIFLLLALLMRVMKKWTQPLRKRRTNRLAMKKMVVAAREETGRIDGDQVMSRRKRKLQTKDGGEMTLTQQMIEEKRPPVPGEELQNPRLRNPLQWRNLKMSLRLTLRRLPWPGMTRI